MKYIHDGKNLVIWSAFSPQSHQDMSRFMGMKPVHAGHVGFGKKASDFSVSGQSRTLKLKFKKFSLPPDLWVGVYGDLQVIGTNKALIETLFGVAHQATWIQSREDESGCCQVIYPGYDGAPLSTNHVIGR